MNTKPPPKRELLTNKMIEILMDCHEKELMNMPPCTTTTRNVKGLFVRGMLKTRILVTDKGKRIEAFYVSDAGKKYLNKLTS